MRRKQYIFINPINKTTKQMHAKCYNIHCKISKMQRNLSDKQTNQHGKDYPV